MSSLGDLVVLPDRGTLAKRLSEMSCDLPHEKEDFHPLLLKTAPGKELVPVGVVMYLIQTMYDYLRPMLPTHEAAESLTGMMMYRIPAYVDVLLGDTPAAAQAKSFYEESRQRADERVSQTQDP